MYADPEVAMLQNPCNTNAPVSPMAISRLPMTPHRGELLGGDADGSPTYTSPSGGVMDLRSGGDRSQRTPSSCSLAISSARVALAACKSGRSFGGQANARPGSTTPTAPRVSCSGQRSGRVPGASDVGLKTPPPCLSVRAPPPPTVTLLSASKVANTTSSSTPRVLAQPTPSNDKLPSFSANDNGKFLQTLAKRRKEKDLARQLPLIHKAEQLMALENIQRVVLCQEEQNAFTSVTQKKRIGILKQQQEALKKTHDAAMVALKLEVAKSDASLKEELQQRLRCVVQLVPEALEAAVAEYKQEPSSLSFNVLTKLLEEENRLRKGIKTDSCHQNSRNEDVIAEGGSFPFWLSQCLVSQFNAQAILVESGLVDKEKKKVLASRPSTMQVRENQDVATPPSSRACGPAAGPPVPPLCPRATSMTSYRAAVVDVPSMPMKLAHRKRLFVVRKTVPAATQRKDSRTESYLIPGYAGSGRSQRSLPLPPNSGSASRPNVRSSSTTSEPTEENRGHTPRHLNLPPPTTNPSSSTESRSAVVLWGRVHSLAESVGTEEKVLDVMEDIKNVVLDASNTDLSVRSNSGSLLSSRSVMSASSSFNASTGQSDYGLLSAAVETISPTIVWCKEDLTKLSLRLKKSAMTSASAESPALSGERGAQLLSLSSSGITVMGNDEGDENSFSGLKKDLKKFPTSLKEEISTRPLLKKDVEAVVATVFSSA